VGSSSPTEASTPTGSATSGFVFCALMLLPFTAAHGRRAGDDGATHAASAARICQSRNRIEVPESPTVSVEAGDSIALRARGYRRSKPESRSLATPAGSAGDCFTPNNPTTIGATLAVGGAGGDGAYRYAARRRNLALPPARAAAPHGAHEKPAAPRCLPACRHAAATARTIADPRNTAITDRRDDPRPSPPLTRAAKARARDTSQEPSARSPLRPPY
jgi:hypothetical protein